MIKIAHRGNVNGPNIELENHPQYVISAINEAFSCEVDLWNINGKLLLGHDEPQYPIDFDFLESYKHYLWIHCKNLSALDFMLSKDNSFKSFWHQNDDYTITTNGYIWTFPNRPTVDKSILVHLGAPSSDLKNKIYAGICSDYIKQFDLTIKL